MIDGTDQKEKNAIKRSGFKPINLLGCVRPAKVEVLNFINERVSRLVNR